MKGSLKKSIAGIFKGLKKTTDTAGQKEADIILDKHISEQGVDELKELNKTKGLSFMNKVVIHPTKKIKEKLKTSGKKVTSVGKDITGKTIKGTKKVGKKVSGAVVQVGNVIFVDPVLKPVVNMMKRVYIKTKRVENKLDSISNFFNSIPDSLSKWIMPDLQKGGLSYWLQRVTELQSVIDVYASKGQLNEINDALNRLIYNFNAVLLRFTTEFLMTGKPYKTSKEELADFPDRLKVLLDMRDWRRENCSLYLKLCPIEANLEMDTLATILTVFSLDRYKESATNKSLLEYIIQYGYMPKKQIKDIPDWLKFDLFVERATNLIEMLRKPLKDLSAEKTVNEAKSFTEDFRHFTKDIYAFLLKDAQTLFDTGIWDRISRSAARKEQDKINTQNIMRDIVIYHIFLCNVNRIHRRAREEKDMSWYCTHGVGASTEDKTSLFKKLVGKEHRSLNSLWDKNCGLGKKWGVEALFCRAGAGELLPLMIMSLQFRPVSGSPRNHVLYSTFKQIDSIIYELTEDETIRKLLQWGINKIVSAYDLVLNKGGQFLSFRDLDGIATGVSVARKFSKFLDELANIYGLSLSADNVGSRSTDTDNLTRSIDLDKFAKENCVRVGKSAPSLWHHSLLCHIYNFSEIATLIGNLQFTVPDDKSKHIMNMVMNNIKDTTQNVREEGITNWLIKKAGPATVDTLFSDITAKIDSNEPLSWKDLDALYQWLLAKPVISGSLTWNALNDNIASIGLALADPDTVSNYKL